MPEGRAVEIQRAGTPFIGVKSINFEWAGGSLNISSGEDDGYQTLLNASGEEALTISIEGVAKDEVIRDLVLGGTVRLFTDITIVFSNGDTLAVDLRLESYSEGAPYNEAITFSATFASSGSWTYTEAP